MADQPDNEAGVLILPEPKAAQADASYDVNHLLREYVEETRQQLLDTAAAPAARKRATRHALLTLGIVGVLLLAGLGVGILALVKRDPAVASVPQPPAAHEAGDCEHRQETVIRAIFQYMHDHKEPPKDLSLLRPPYLTVPAADPESGVPFQYRRQGNSIWLTCPQHSLASKAAD